MSRARNTLPEPGQITHVRSRRYVTVAVARPEAPGDDTRVSLVCIDDDAHGRELEVLWEREVDAEVVGAASWARVAESGFDRPPVLLAYLRALAWSLVGSGDQRGLRAAVRAGIERTPYQLEPLSRAARSRLVRLFIADDAGLGKTIEAGLIVRELLDTRRARRVVVVCPPSVRFQWQRELERRFGLHFVVYDRAFASAKRRERGFGANPFAAHSHFIVSHVLLRDELHASLLRGWMTGRPRTGASGPDAALLVFDEAHNAAPSARGAYATSSRFVRSMREIAPLFEHRLFLSATSHGSNEDGFRSLLELLDPVRFSRGSELDAGAVEALVVRRTQRDLAAAGVRFPVRELVCHDIDALPDDEPEVALARLLERYRALSEARLGNASKSVAGAMAAVFATLERRLLSSIEAFATAIGAHARAREKAALRARPANATAERGVRFDRALLDAPGPDDERAELGEEEARAADEEALVRASDEALSQSEYPPAERELVEAMQSIVESSRALPDARVKALATFIQSRCLDESGTRGSDCRVVVFTEYAETKRHLERTLRALLAPSKADALHIATLYGGMNDEAREEVQRAFNARPEAHPLRVLIATDAAREGVNLQNHCADLVHFDVPWSPNRIEQREGRIDRKLQRSSVVRFHHFVRTGRPEDAVLAALLRRTEGLRHTKGSSRERFEAEVAERFEAGLGRSDFSELLATEKNVHDHQSMEVDETQRGPLLAARLRELEAEARACETTMGFDEEAFRATVLQALELQSHPPLALDEAVASWRGGPMKTVSFEDSGSIDDDCEHLFLDHPFVERLLGRLVAQGVAHRDIARAAVAASADGAARVAVIGRVTLFGANAERLHDELIAVAARWVEPEARTGPLEAEVIAVGAVERALRNEAQLPEALAKKFAASIERDVHELAPAVEALADDSSRRVNAPSTKRVEIAAVVYLWPAGRA